MIDVFFLAYHSFNRLQIYPQVVGIEEGVALDVGKHGFIAAVALSRFSKHQLTVFKPCQMSAFAIHIGSVGYFHQEIQPLALEIAENACVDLSTQVIDV